jgi:uncharacterized protein (TIGR03086 family)
MSHNLRVFTKALYQFDHVARQATPDHWNRPSPCEGWTARHIVGHVVAVQHYMESLIRGTEPTMNPMKEPQRHAEGHAYEAWAAQRDTILEALDHDGVLHREVQNWNGPATVDAMIGNNVGDTTIHAWDLAQALEVDDHLDPQLVQHVLGTLTPVIDGMRGPIMFGPAVDVAADASPQDRLLALSGRQP